MEAASWFIYLVPSDSKSPELFQGGQCRIAVKGSIGHGQRIKRVLYALKGYKGRDDIQHLRKECISARCSAKVGHYTNVR